MTTYESYIRPHLLPPVEPLEGAKEDPDEQFFIRTHQAFEIWFAQMLAELEFARRLLSQYVPEDGVPLITHHVRRAAAIFDLLRSHLPVLESLLTTSFFDFRRRLFGAGGVQSYRFREVEWLIGFRDGNLATYAQERSSLAREHGDKTASPSQADREYESILDYARAATRLIEGLGPGLDVTRQALMDREKDLREKGSLRQQVLRWLQGTPYPAAGGSEAPSPLYGDLFVERFRRSYHLAYQEDLELLTAQGLMAREGVEQSSQSALRRLDWFLQMPERRALLFILQFAAQPLLAWPAALLEALLELDEAYLIWRDRHIAMVARVLGGGRISTTGAPSSGLQYLQRTLAKRAFPEIWDARTFLLGQREASSVYSNDPQPWGEWQHFRLAFEAQSKTS